MFETGALQFSKQFADSSTAPSPLKHVALTQNAFYGVQLLHLAVIVLQNFWCSTKHFDSDVKSSF